MDILHIKMNWSQLFCLLSRNVCKPLLRLVDLLNIILENPLAVILKYSACLIESVLI